LRLKRELESFACKWDGKYGAISGQWRKHWVNVIPLFDYPDEIRKVLTSQINLAKIQ
jgi:transposase-like protein